MNTTAEWYASQARIAELEAANADLVAALRNSLPYLGSAANEHINPNWDENAIIEEQARAALAKAKQK